MSTGRGPWRGPGSEEAAAAQKAKDEKRRKEEEAAKAAREKAFSHLSATGVGLGIAPSKPVFIDNTLLQAVGQKAALEALGVTSAASSSSSIPAKTADKEGGGGWDVEIPPLHPISAPAPPAPQVPPAQQHIQAANTQEPSDLPPGWNRAFDPKTRRPYYYQTLPNGANARPTWRKPRPQEPSSLLPPAGWYRAFSEKHQRHFYYTSDGRFKQWRMPEDEYVADASVAVEEQGREGEAVATAEVEAASSELHPQSTYAPHPSMPMSMQNLPMPMPMQGLPMPIMQMPPGMVMMPQEMMMGMGMHFGGFPMTDAGAVPPAAPSAGLPPFMPMPMAMVQQPPPAPPPPQQHHDQQQQQQQQQQQYEQQQYEQHQQQRPRHSHYHHHQQRQQQESSAADPLDPTGTGGRWSDGLETQNNKKKVAVSALAAAASGGMAGAGTGAGEGDAEGREQAQPPAKRSRWE